jgi:hypothetical protein
MEAIFNFRFHEPIASTPAHYSFEFRIFSRLEDLLLGFLIDLMNDDGVGIVVVGFKFPE